VHRLLVLQERLSISLASATLVVNDAMRDRLIALGVSPSKVSVVRNSPSLTRFDAAAHDERPFRADGSLRIVYTGGLTPIYELDTVILAIARLVDRRADLDPRLDIYGRGDSEPALRALAETSGIADRVAFHGRIPIDDVPAVVAKADIGVAPTRRDPFTDLSLSTKVFEYAAMGKPVVASRLPMVERTFPPGTVSVYEPGDPVSLADAIAAIADDAPVREAAVERTAAIVADAAWEREATSYLAIVAGLTDGST
jgi:glycosyltransferase involved in cell wall biosynthesis